MASIAAAALFPHLTKSTPAFTVGAGLMVIVLVSKDDGHEPPVEVKVKVTVPDKISAALGV